MGTRPMFVCALLAIAAAAHAADEQGRFAIKDIGLATCADYLQARQAKSPDYFRFGGWVGGYLTATNRYERDTFDLAPWQTIGMLTSWLADLCEKNPHTPFVRAVTALANRLSEHRLRTHSELLTLTAGQHSTPVYAEVLMQVQRQLQGLGYKGIEPNAHFDPPTRAAMESYQRAQALEPTGLPDPATLSKLLRQ